MAKTAKSAATPATRRKKTKKAIAVKSAKPRRPAKKKSLRKAVRRSTAEVAKLRKAVISGLKSGKPAAALARQLGISRPYLYRLNGNG